MPLVSLDFDGDVALILIDNPPVNSGDSRMRADLRSALLAAQERRNLRAVVVGTAGRHFYAGSDLREFDDGIEEPELPDLITLLERIEVPVVAALTGFTLGGGLEFALGCDARICDPGARFGFPETTLGILPGAGGTVRSARLLGIPAAVDLVATGRQVGADEALRLGLVDEVVDGEDVVSAAVQYARGLKAKRRLRDLPPPGATAAEVEAARTAVPPRARPNVLQAAELIIGSAELDVDTALSAERALFKRLLDTEESRNLRYLFFAKRSAAKSLKSPRGTAPSSIASIGIAGAGTMGAALAQVCVSAGYAVRVFDLNEAARARLSASVPEATTVEHVSGFAGVDLVIDAVFEDMEVKKTLFASIEPVVVPTTVLASNTSYLDLNEIASVLDHPERFGGLHFFNPPGRNPLVEIIGADATDDATLAALGAVAARLGKTAIPAGIGDGFVANRVYADYRAQAEFLLEDGATVQQVDQAMTALGLPVGPFAVADMSGLDIAWARRKRLAATRPADQRYVAIPDELCRIGRLGKKSGMGWYDYPEGARRGVPAPEVEGIIAEARERKGLTAQPIGELEIQRRILASMLCAATTLVEAGTAQRASDIDVALTEGFAFPRWLGGPLRMLSGWETEELVDALATVHASCPVTFAVAEPAAQGVLAPSIAHVLESVRPTTPAYSINLERASVGRPAGGTHVPIHSRRA